ERAIGRFVDADDQRRRAIFLAEIVTDAGGLRHFGLAVDHQGNGAERVEREVLLGEYPWRERQHFEVVGQPHLFQHPQRPERARGAASIKRNHPSFPCSRFFSLLIHSRQRAQPSFLNSSCAGKISAFSHSSTNGLISMAMNFCSSRQTSS